MRHALVLIPLVVAGLLPFGFAAADDPAPAAKPSAAAPGARPIDAAAVRRSIERLDDEVKELGGRVGVEVVSLPDAAVVGAAHERDPINPASNAKLATAAAALSTLGPDHRFVTGLYGSNKGGQVETLILRGSGDPTLQTEHLHLLARGLRNAGVREVGRIAVDQSAFDDEWVPPAFGQQPNEWAAFRAPVSAVSLNRNTVTLWFRPTKKGDAAAVEVDPPGSLDVEGSVGTSAKDSAEKITLTLSTKADRLHARVGGSIPEGSKLVPVTKRVDDPRRLAGVALRTVLVEQGIKIGPEVILATPAERADKRALALHRSPALGQILPMLGKDSDNFAAEMLFKAIGAEVGGGPDAASATRAMDAFLKSRGALDSGSIVVNGSGLFDANRATAHGVATLLSSVARDPALAPEFEAHLAIGGVDGTLRSRFGAWKERRAIRAKTGTLAGVVALSGYVLGPDGRGRIAFSILVDGVKGKTHEARKAIDDAVDGFAESVWSQK